MILQALRTEEPKLDALCRTIEATQGLAIAFSGGVDSTLLTFLAHELLKDKMVAITVRAPYIATWEVDEATSWTQGHRIPHVFIDAQIADSIVNNPVDRCYLCKHVVFTNVIERARAMGIHTVTDGSNKDDLSDYRPGMKALKELSVRSLFLEEGISKQDIRQWSKALGLETWDKPPYACLLTRLPYDTQVIEQDLRQIEDAEAYLIGIGFRAVRVRKHGTLARIEIAKENMPSFLEVDLMKTISKALKAIGFEYVALDMEGYVTGSFNQGIR